VGVVKDLCEPGDRVICADEQSSRRIREPPQCGRILRVFAGAACGTRGIEDIDGKVKPARRRDDARQIGFAALNRSPRREPLTDEYDHGAIGVQLCEACCQIAQAGFQHALAGGRHALRIAPYQCGFTWGSRSVSPLSAVEGRDVPHQGRAIASEAKRRHRVERPRHHGEVAREHLLADEARDRITDGVAVHARPHMELVQEECKDACAWPSSLALLVGAGQNRRDGDEILAGNPSELGGLDRPGRTVFADCEIRRTKAGDRPTQIVGHDDVEAQQRSRTVLRHAMGGSEDTRTQETGEARADAQPGRKRRPCYIRS
jgi:hypothetical protein